MNENKLIAKNTLILYFRLLSTSVIGLFTSRFVIQSLGAADFGLYSIVGGIVVMMAFLNTIMIATTYRYIAYEMGKGNNENINKIFNVSFVIHLCMALLFLILTETVGVYYVKNYLNVASAKVPDALFVLRFSTYATVFSIISVPFQGLITAQEKFAVQAIIEIIRSLLGLLVAITIIYYIGSRIRLYALLIAIANIVPSLLFYVYCNHKYSEIIKWNFQRVKSKYKEMISFSGWNMIGAAAIVGNTTGSALIINALFGTVMNAAFAIANQLNNIVLMFAMNLAQATIPQITKSFSSGNTDRTFNLVAYTSKYTWFLMLLPALPFLLETDFLLKLWLEEFPPYTIIFCQLIIISTLVNGIGNGLMAVVHATGKIKYFQIILSTTSLLSLPIAYILFKIGFPPYTIIFVIIITKAVNIVVSQILLKIIINFNVRSFLKISYLRIFYVAILIAPLFFIQNIFSPGSLRVVLFSMFSMGWLIVAIYFAGLEKKEKEILSQLLRKYLKPNNKNIERNQYDTNC